MIQLEKNKNLDHPKAKVHLQMQGKPNIKNSRSEVFYTKGVLESFAKFTGKHQCWSFSFNKVARLWPAMLLKETPTYVNFAKFLELIFL